MKSITIIVFVLLSMECYTQEPATLPREEERIMEASEEVDEEDEQLQLWHFFRKNPLDLNLACAEELHQLGLNAFQANALLEHRKKFGALIAVQELQAIKGWDLSTIRALLPYIMVGQSETRKDHFKNGWKKGDHFLLMRISTILEKSKGYLTSSGPPVYEGGQSRTLLRYRYQSKAGFQVGFTAEKDAGEKYFGSGKPFGFDFTSAYIQVKNFGVLKTIVAGDYKIQIGQGLICWQGNGFRKGAGSIQVKRQGPILVPYSAAGEFLYSRGIATEWEKNRWRVLTFFSARKFTASIETNQQGAKEISSISQSGLHRTKGELDKRNNVFSRSYGMSASYIFTNGHLSLNAVQHIFNIPFSAGNRPYQLFEFTGNKIGNAGMDYSFTWNNFHTSGEWAVSQSGKIAIVNNVMIALDSKVDLVLLHRYYEKSYTSFQAAAFSAHPVPANEAGFYTGISLRPQNAWKIDAYADMVLFPWLKFRADAPSSSSAYALLVRYTPSRKAEWYVRLRKELSEMNFETDDHFTILKKVSTASIRTHMGLQLTREWTIRQRFEMTRMIENSVGRYGSLYYAEAFYKPPSGRAGYNFRLAVFNTDGYDTRIYQYEQDVLFNASVPSLDGKGIRYYINAHRKLRLERESRGWKADVYLRYAQTIYADRMTISSGMDQINSNKRSELKVQLIFSSI